MGEAKRRRERELKLTPEAGNVLWQYARGQPPSRDLPPPSSPREVLELVAKMREMVRGLRDGGYPEPYVVDPVSGERLGLFDPEQDALLGDLERAALAKLRRAPHER
jgi:hypothetical protein